MLHIPLPLRNLPQWVTYSGLIKKDGSLDKKPLQKVNEPESHLLFREAYETGFYGFAPTKNDKVLLIDIDHNIDLTKLPSTLSKWIKTNNPYIEISPSGKGLRILARTVSKEVKKNIISKYAKSKIKGFDGQITIHGHYQTFTNNYLQGKEIPVMFQSIFDELFAIKYVETKGTIIDFESKKEVTSVVPFDIEVIEKQIMSFPLNQGERIKRIYKNTFGEEYEHYQYWVTIGMGLHELGSKFNPMVLLECKLLFLKWSRLDVESYVDEKDVLSHWDSFAKKKKNITYASILKLFRNLEFTWPYPRFIQKKNTGLPDILEYQNFEYLLKHYNITYTLDVVSKKGYITGDQDTLDKYSIPNPASKDQLITSFYSMAIDNHFRKYSLQASRAHTLHWISQQASKNSVNIFKEWILSDLEPYNSEEAQVSTLDYIWSCISISKHYKIFEPLFKRFFYIFFMNIIKSHFYEGIYDDHAGMLLLIGPENSHKTTFFKMLFPEQFREFVADLFENLETPASIRDANKIASNNLIIVINEFDSIYNASNDAKFKMFLTDRKSTFIDKYMVDETKCFKYAIPAGTTNSTTIKFGRDGTRRIMSVFIQFINTNKLAKVNWHLFYKNFYEKEYKPALAKTSNTLPWILKPNEINELQKLNNDHSAKSSLSMYIRSIFDFYAPFSLEGVKSIQTDDSGLVLSLAEIEIRINAYLRMNQIKYSFTRAHLSHVLKDLLGYWTDTRFKAVQRDANPKCLISDGLATQGQYKKYLVPPTIPLE